MTQLFYPREIITLLDRAGRNQSVRVGQILLRYAGLSLGEAEQLHQEISRVFNAEPFVLANTPERAASEYLLNLALRGQRRACILCHLPLAELIEALPQQVRYPHLSQPEQLKLVIVLAEPSYQRALESGCKLNMFGGTAKLGESYAC